MGEKLIELIEPDWNEQLKFTLTFYITYGI